ncbi:unnamed protein product, partial [Bubo scandiacus]
ARARASGDERRRRRRRPRRAGSRRDRTSERAPPGGAVPGTPPFPHAPHGSRGSRARANAGTGAGNRAPAFGGAGRGGEARAGRPPSAGAARRRIGAGPRRRRRRARGRQRALARAGRTPPPFPPFSRGGRRGTRRPRRRAPARARHTTGRGTRRAPGGDPPRGPRFSRRAGAPKGSDHSQVRPSSRRSGRAGADPAGADPRTSLNHPIDLGFPGAARRVMGITPPDRQSASFMDQPGSRHPRRTRGRPARRRALPTLTAPALAPLRPAGGGITDATVAAWQRRHRRRRTANQAPGAGPAARHPQRGGASPAPAAGPFPRRRGRGAGTAKQLFAGARAAAPRSQPARRGPSPTQPNVPHRSAKGRNREEAEAPRPRVLGQRQPRAPSRHPRVGGADAGLCVRESQRDSAGGEVQRRPEHRQSRPAAKPLRRHPEMPHRSAKDGGPTATGPGTATAARALPPPAGGRGRRGALRAREPAGQRRSTPTAGPPWAPPVAGHQVYPSSGTKKHPTGKKRKKKKKRKNREKNPPYHGAGAGPLGNRGGGQVYPDGRPPAPPLQGHQVYPGSGKRKKKKKMEKEKRKKKKGAGAGPLRRATRGHLLPPLPAPGGHAPLPGQAEGVAGPPHRGAPHRGARLRGEKQGGAAEGGARRPQHRPGKQQRARARRETNDGGDGGGRGGPAAGETERASERLREGPCRGPLPSRTHHTARAGAEPGRTRARARETAHRRSAAPAAAARPEPAAPPPQGRPGGGSAPGPDGGGGGRAGASARWRGPGEPLLLSPPFPGAAGGERGARADAPQRARATPPAAGPAARPAGTPRGAPASRGARVPRRAATLRLEPQTFPPAPTPLPPAPAAAAAAAAATPLWRPGTEPAGTPLGPKVSRLPSPERPICCWRKARGGRRDPDAGERRPVPDANLAPARQTGVSAGGDGGGWGEGGGRFCCPVAWQLGGGGGAGRGQHGAEGLPGRGRCPPTPSRRARGGGCVWGRGGVGGGGEARSTPTAGPPWAPPVAGHQVYPSSGTKKHPTGKKRKKKKKRKNREKNPPYHGAGAGPLGNRGGGQRRVPHDHAVRDGGEAAPHPSTPPVPTTSGAPHRARPSRGRAAGYREPTEAPAALRYRYV